GGLVSTSAPTVRRATIDRVCAPSQEVPPIPAVAQLRTRFPSGVLGWHDYADVWLGEALGVFLDYGCGDGSLLRRVVERCHECWRLDVDGDRMKQASKLPGVRVRPLATDGGVPFPDATFHNVAITEVIEHVADERRVLAELSRVLKPGGRLLLTTPHRGLLTFFDPANIKF